MKFIDVVNASPAPVSENELAATAPEGENAEVTTETGHAANTEGGVLSSLGINGTLFTFQLINFAIVAAILWFLILKPITKKMSERAKMIDDSIENAKKIENNLAHSEQKYQEKIDMAKVDANRILEKANVEAENVTNEMREKAKKEINTLVDQAKRNIKIEKEEMVLEVKKEAAKLVAEALEKILGDKMDEKKDAKLIEESLNKITG